MNLLCMSTPASFRRDAVLRDEGGHTPRTAVITQPCYLPWMGYFEQIARADVFVFLDVVQFVPRSWHSRNRLKGHDGQPFWLSVPVVACPQATPLCNVQIADDGKWRQSHLRSIRMHLGKAPFFHEVFPRIEALLLAPHKRLVDLNIAVIRSFADLIGLAPTFLLASELGGSGRRTELLVDLCRRVGAEHYYTSAGSQMYMQADEHLFVEAGISWAYQDWTHPVYRQEGSGFVSHLSVVDALMNIGPAAVGALVRGEVSEL